MFLFLGFAGLLVIPLGIYLYVILCRSLNLFFGNKNLRIQKMTAAVTAAASAVKSINLFGVWALVVCYFAAVTLVIDLIRLLWKMTGRRKARQAGQGKEWNEQARQTEQRKAWSAEDGYRYKEENSSKKNYQGVWNFVYRSGILAAAVTAVIIGYAYVNMHHVITTRYTVSAKKPIRDEGYRVVFVSDLHFGTTMDREMLEEYCARMEQEEPDLVVLGGDIVDEYTTLKEAGEAFEAFAQIDSTYGTYYVYGNHDKGRYSAECDFTQAELAAEIQRAGVHILEDDTVMLGEELVISGRRDRSDAAMDQMQREPAQELIEDLSGIRDEQPVMTDDKFQTRYCIVADHQPRDMEENASAGYDLMLSGHTHAGQMWPVGLFTTLFDKSTVNYGRKSFGDMELIVSSGMAGWGYPLRTGKHSEYVVIQITD